MAQIDRTKNTLGVGPSGKKRWLSNGSDDNADVRAGAAGGAADMGGMDLSALTADTNTNTVTVSYTHLTLPTKA